MADVYTVVFSVLGILLSGPALLLVLNLLLPKQVGRAATRLSKTPGWSFVLGVPVAAAMGLWIAIASQVPWGPARASAWGVGVLGLGLLTIGAAGLVRMLGDRLGNLSSNPSNLTNMLRGAVLYELALLFPVIGWFLFAPLAGITALGAGTFALLRWVPRPSITVVDQSAPAVDGAFERRAV